MKNSQDSSERKMNERLGEACVLYQAAALGSGKVNPGLRGSCLIHSSGNKNMPLSFKVPASHKYGTAPWNMKFGPMFWLWRESGRESSPTPILQNNKAEKKVNWGKHPSWKGLGWDGWTNPAVWDLVVLNSGVCWYLEKMFEFFLSHL